MTPSLALRGRLIVACAALFVIAGGVHADAWPLLALGTVIVCAVCSAYLWFYPTAILLRRRKIELAWWVPPGDQPGGALTVEHTFPLHVALRNHGPVALRVLDLKVIASEALIVPDGLEAKVPRGLEVELKAGVRARAAGHWALHGAVVQLGDLLGLFEVRAYFPNPLSLKIFPRQMRPGADAPLLRPQVGAPDERGGAHRIRRRGLSGDLREIREHQYGDPFKMIAWKATARKRRLMVRDLENEIVMTHQILVDVGAGMRGGLHGRTRLDYAIETAAALARLALDGGDRVGLITFDARVYGKLKPGEGRPHLLQVVDRLLETRNVVDEDMTDLTDGELVSSVARYLAHQEAIDVRLRVAPPVDDPAWARIAAGPGGELYDMAAMGKVVGALLKVHSAVADPTRRAPAWWWSRVYISDGSDAEMARLRLFCRLRGIELPYKHASAEARSAGLAAALRAATAGERSQFVIVISDLDGVLEEPATAVKQIGLMRRKHQQMVVVSPQSARLAPRRSTPAGQKVDEVLSIEERRRHEAARALLAPVGVPVILAGPEDGAAVLARRFGKAAVRLRGHG
jgi:uncharacterized protein (DUF58 family)